ncbi:hypothetical protein BJY52DRAFT_858956 [Lactarius psammicola]|nr:hypothetical protein BJY52DRAFT_858956 [Lactarius psammicola]
MRHKGKAQGSGMNGLWLWRKRRPNLAGTFPLCYTRSPPAVMTLTGTHTLTTNVLYIFAISCPASVYTGGQFEVRGFVRSWCGSLILGSVICFRSFGYELHGGSKLLMICTHTGHTQFEGISIAKLFCCHVSPITRFHNFASHTRCYSRLEELSDLSPRKV